ncbi:MAG: redoxin domain-containing protein [Acidobacteria bacterium]|nr:redoxin domain-containing protein [Acidobacteriota bacterium]
MKFRAIVLAGGLALSYGIATSAQQAPPAKQAAPAVAHTHLKVGDMAPDFTMRSHDGKQVKLSDFRGKKNVVLAFYVLAFTGG